MSFSEIISQPRMLLQKSESRISFKQLKGFADTHGSWHFNKQVDVIKGNVQLINFESLPVSNLSDEELTIHSNSIELHRVHGILAFPHEVESILSKGMFSTFQIHFSSPKIAHAKFDLVSGGLGSNPSLSRIHKQLNFEGGDSSPGLKAWVSSPRM